MTTKPPLLDVRELTVEFRQTRRTPPLRAVDSVSFTVAAGETLGLVGESGSGKTTIGRAILGLVPAQAGQILFDSTDITHAGYRTRRSLSAHLQTVFQDPYSSLNPARTIGRSLAEPLLVHAKLSRAETNNRVRAMLGRVGLPTGAADSYPSQFSGGQRQRIAIARAFMTSPKLVICDEPLSALDLSIQAQVMNLLTELQAELGLSYLFIAHDLPVIRRLSHRITVLYRGQVVETGPAEQVYHQPGHPYTRMLLAAVPDPDPRVQHAHHDQPPATPSEAVPVAGCPFAPRCAHAIEICRTERPRLLPIWPPSRDGAGDGHAVACHRTAELAIEPINSTAAVATTGGCTDRFPTKGTSCPGIAL